MVKKTIIATLIAAGLAFSTGCGPGETEDILLGEDYETHSRLVVLSITDADTGETSISWPANREAEDENNNQFPDAGETTVSGGDIPENSINITVENVPRPGQDGVDLSIYQVNWVWVDEEGFTWSWAPAGTWSNTVTIGPGETADLEVIVAPSVMRTSGLTDYWHGIQVKSDGTQAAVKQWTLFLEVFARDTLNDFDTSVTSAATVSFFNPME